MTQFGETILLLGDFHIPQRTVDLPPKFKEILIPGKVQHIICTGNLGDRLDWIKNLGGNLHSIRGDNDESNLPESKVLTIGQWKIGAVHGHQIIPWLDKEALSNYQRILDCDILVYGHTHMPSVETMENKHFLNPGSATGAYSSFTSEVRPSFMVLTVQGKEASVYCYELVDDEIQVSKTEIFKN